MYDKIMAERQTQTYLKNLFERRGIAPRKQFGQNFLIDLNLHDLIIETAAPTEKDVILEVGSGTGALTSALAEKAAAVVTVEIDEGMAKLTREAVDGRPNVRVVEGDALQSKHVINPIVLDHLRAALAVDPERRLKLVANLPYNVATPIISNLIVNDELRPVLFVVTIQLEMAEKMRAKPSTADFGALSVLIQALADVEIVRVLRPAVFWPRPNVDSAIVAIATRPEKRALITDLTWFHKVTRQIFLQRRKNLRGVLFNLGRERWTKPEVDQFLEAQGIDGRVRAESLEVGAFLKLAEGLKERLGEEIENNKVESF